MYIRSSIRLQFATILLLTIFTTAISGAQVSPKSAARKDGQTCAIRPSGPLTDLHAIQYQDLDRARKKGDVPAVERLHRALGWRAAENAVCASVESDSRRVVRRDRVDRSLRWQADVLVSFVEWDSGRPSLTAGYQAPTFVVAEDLQGNYLDVYRSDDGGYHWYYAFSLETTFDPTRPCAVVACSPQVRRLIIAYEYGRETSSAAIHVYWEDLDTGESNTIMVDSGWGIANPSLCVDVAETQYWYAYLSYSKSGIRDGRDYGEIKFSRSVSFGNTWSSPVSVASNVTDSDNPDIDFGGTDLYVAFTRPGETDDRDVYVRQSANWGESWLAELPLAYSANDEFDPAVAATNGGTTAMVAYTRQYSPTNTDVECYYSTDGGTLWNWTYPAYDSQLEGPADLCTDTVLGRIHAAYWRHGDVAYTGVPYDQPTAWSAPEVVNEGQAAVNIRPSIAANGDRAIEECIAWMDDRAPTLYRVYFDAAYPLGDYVMVAGDIPRRDALLDLKTWKEQLGYRVDLWTMDQVQNAFPSSNAAKSLWNFLADRRFNTRYVLLAGHLQQIPMRLLYPDGDIGDGRGFGSDYYYMKVSNPFWDVDQDFRWGEFTQDSLSPYPDLLVGRVPNIQGAEVADWVANVIAFEGDTGDWKKNVLLAAGFLSHPAEDDISCDMAISSEIFRLNIFDPAGWPVTRLYDGIGLNPTFCEWDRLLTGANFVVECGLQTQGLIHCMAHGSGTHMIGYRWVADLNQNGYCDYGLEKTNIDFSLYTSVQYFPTSAVVFHGACETAPIIAPDEDHARSGLASLYLIDDTFTNLAVYEYLKHGSPAFIGSTVGSAAYALWDNPDDGYSQSLYYYFYQMLVQYGMRVGDAFHGAMINHWLQHYPTREVRTFNYFGDPSLEFLGTQGRRWRSYDLPVEYVADGAWPLPPAARDERAQRQRRDGDDTLWWRESLLADATSISELVVGQDGLLYAALSTSVDETRNGGAVRRSADGGATWEPAGELPELWAINSLLQTVEGYWLLGGVVLDTGQLHGAIYISVDNCASWEPVVLVMDGVVWDLCEVGGNIILAGTGWGGGVIVSWNGGIDWEVAAALGTHIDVRGVTQASNGLVFIACDGAGAVNKVLVSADAFEWFPVDGLSDMTAAHEIIESGGELFVGGSNADGGAVYRGPMDGSAFAPTDSLPSPEIKCVRSLAATADGIVFAGGEVRTGRYATEVFAWSPVDETWTPYGGPLESARQVDALLIGGEYMYAGTGDVSGAVYKHVATASTGVEEAPLPEGELRLTLWPNPTRDRVKIDFNLPGKAEFEVSVYDVSGRLVKTLRSDSVAGEDHSILWDGMDAQGRPVPSGVYFFRVDNGSGNHRMGKVVLVK